MKFSFGPRFSDYFILVYAVITLYIRFKLEQEVEITTLNSLLIGAFFVIIIYVMIKVKVLNPNWFGLFNSKKSEQ
ncbi:hypothetical protein [Crocinitomix algicola]|uniref:hypothetical protein n=1 Tax=Crocinitomix algicola TaxID=1740263 RepID=UPI0008348427|nr:hypothetical protein [Crocinitomix algicola]